MLERQPSRTALAAAGYRAVHQILENGAVFRDPLAGPILGEIPEAILAGQSADPGQTPTRLFMAARSRFAEDRLARAVAGGLRQAVVLGAGLDTLGLRNPHAASGLSIFEVDHPATQAWKLRRLAETGLTRPASLTFAAIDLEHEELGPGLAAVGFDASKPALFIWLGVVPYLGRAGIMTTLGFIAGVPRSEVVFDYSEPLENYPPEHRGEMIALGARAAAVGEPWLSHFAPQEVADMLNALGMTEQEDIDRAEISARYLDGPPRTAPEVGPHVIWAGRPS